MGAKKLIHILKINNKVTDLANYSIKKYVNFLCIYDIFIHLNVFTKVPLTVYAPQSRACYSARVPVTYASFSATKQQ